MLMHSAIIVISQNEYGTLVIMRDHNQVITYLPGDFTDPPTLWEIIILIV